MAVLAFVVTGAGALLGPQTRAWASGVTLNGEGSSFAAPVVENWIATVANAPYGIFLTYAGSSSEQALYGFANESVDYGVSDLTYGTYGPSVTPPSFPFIYVPIVAAGIAFMYNIPGLTQTLQLTSYTACGVLTGGITNWDDPIFHADGANAGVTLPDLPIVPVTESDPSQPNYAMESWCIAEQPVLWAAFAWAENNQTGGPTAGVSISPTEPGSEWPGILPNGLDDYSTEEVASNVQSTQGSIGAVQLQYAQSFGFGRSPAEGVASVLNASGYYTQPTPVDVASALAYDSQQPNGVVSFDFNGLGPNVYDPSTYSYLLIPTTGWSPSKGAVMSQFVNYALTVGQQHTAAFGYASLGLTLEQYGVDSVQASVPGAVGLTSDEEAAYTCGDLTPTEVAAGQTSPTCGGTNPGTGTPETPVALLLPLAAGSVMGVVLWRTRRKGRARAT